MTVYSIKQKKRNELEGFLSKKGIRPNDLENSQSDYFAKKKKNNKQTQKHILKRIPRERLDNQSKILWNYKN